MKRLAIILILSCACIFSYAQDKIIVTIAGKDTAGFSGDGDFCLNARFNFPESICFDKYGNIYIADVANNRVRKIAVSTNIITTIAGKDSSGYSGDNGPATNAKLFYPVDVFVDTADNLYIADALNNRIRKVKLSTGIISTIAGNGTIAYSGDNGPATDASLNEPSGVCVDRFGNVYIADYLNGVVRKTDAVTGIITTIAGNGAIGYAGDGGPATGAKFQGPVKVFNDSAGNVLISDQLNNVIRKVSVSTSIITTIAGNGTGGYSGDGTQATNAQLNQPGGIRIDKQGDLYVAEFGNGVIRKINSGTSIISTIAGIGVWGYSGDGGPATNAKIIPGGVCIDSLGVIYIADYNNHAIRKVYDPTLAKVPRTFLKSDIKVYPNPAKDELNIEYSYEKNDTGFLQIVDLTGRVIQTANLSNKKQSEVVNISSLSRGLYLYRVTQNYSIVSVGKIIKE